MPRHPLRAAIRLCSDRHRTTCAELAFATLAPSIAHDTPDVSEELEPISVISLRLCKAGIEIARPILVSGGSSS